MTILWWCFLHANSLALVVFGVGMLHAKVTGARLLNDRFVGDGFGAHFGRLPLSKVCVLCSYIEGGVLMCRPPLAYSPTPFSCLISVVIVFVFLLYIVRRCDAWKTTRVPHTSGSDCWRKCWHRWGSVDGRETNCIRLWLGMLIIVSRTMWCSVSDDGWVHQAFKVLGTIKFERRT